MNKKIIALDIGNVCIRIQPEKCAETLNMPLSSGIPETLLESIDKMERNLISEQAWMADFQKITKYKFTDNELRSAYNRILGEELEGIKEFLQEKRSEGYRIIFFSDTSEVHINSIYRELSFANIITGGIFSFDTGAKKPESEMYEAFEKLYGKPDIYLDDKPDNIKAGRKRSWNSYLFTDVKSLIEDINLNS